MLNKIIRSIVIFPLYIADKWLDILFLAHKRLKNIGLDYKLAKLDGLSKKVTHIAQGNNINMQFFTPNSLCNFRADTFSTKEPETLSWIEEFGGNNAVLFDVGANVGLYSIYHSKVNKGQTIAFEPSFFNLKLLTKNININNCQELITVVSNPLSSVIGINNFSYGNTDEGGALSSFGVNFGYDGKIMQKQITLKVLGMSLDWMLKHKLITQIPNLVKIDVDGIEHIILEGAKETLSHKDCKSVLIEVNDDFSQQVAGVRELLKSYGFELRDKLHGDMFNSSGRFSHNFNQIWVKDTSV